MCGIAGKVSLKGQVVTKEAVIDMTTSLAHRGPDDAGAYCSPDQVVGLGHRRLSILDLSAAGHQPMRYLNRYVIVFNGEIYNYQELRQQLEAAGYRFTSQTDTEVILALYDKYGSQTPEYLRGMFAFAIYDEQEQRLFCARDRLGKKPFKYYLNDHTFIFASEIKAILTQPEVPREVDLTAIDLYLTWQYVPAPRTGFQNINKLPPAHTLELDVKTGRHTIRRYWSPSYTPDTTHAEQEWIERLRTTLAEAVSCRMVADVPLGAFLSGGVDSAAIVATMAMNSPKPIKTFSIGFDDAAHDETATARLVAKRYKTDHHELFVKPNASEMIEMLTTFFDEPFADSSAIPTYYVSRAARQHVTVALSGDGGDELFAGYRQYTAHRVAALLSRIPEWSTFSSSTPSLSRWRRFVQSLSQNEATRHLTYNAYFTHPMRKHLYTKQFLHEVSPLASAPTYPQLRDSVTNAMAYDTHTYLPDDILAKVDSTSMATSLEVRCPLLDHKFVELATSIPVDLKLKGWRGHKYIWKKAMSDRVPAKILNQPKHGFTVPLSSWLKGPLKPLLHETLLSTKAKQRGIFETREIQRLITAHQNGQPSLARPLWALLMLELWWEQYVD